MEKNRPKKKIVLVKADQKEKERRDYSNLPAPSDQVKLKPDDLLEEIARILTIKKNEQPTNNVCYSNKQKKWVQIPKKDDSHIYLNYEGNYFFKNSQDAKIYLLEKEKIEAKRRLFYDPKIVDDYIDKDNVRKFRVLKNDFNFASRRTQTKSIVTREAESQTDAAKKINFSDNISPYIISRIYEEDFANNAKLGQKSMRAKKTAIVSVSKLKPKIFDAQEQKIQQNERFKKSAMILERMISQNNLQDIVIDYKHWDDEADIYRTEGSLLPLWKFSNNLTKRRAITAISWSTYYSDLFAVATGSCNNFLKKTPGSIICFTLKNPNNPQFKIETSLSCMTIQFNPREPYLLAAGFYDGSVYLYDLRLINNQKKTKYYYKSEARHYGPVWQVQWLPPNSEQYENFISVSADSRIFNWELKKNILVGTQINFLKVFGNDPKIKYSDEFKQSQLRLIGDLEKK
ncbi:dynein intermediate chain ciliary-like isoform X2, partial [Brachionus plicatilis]